MTVLAVWPVVIWAGMQPWSVRFAGYGATMVSLAQISGLVGITLFAQVLILGSRVAWLENYFGGLGRMYVIHHQAGGLALILLLFHPLFTAAAGLPVSLAQAGALIWPLQSWVILLGWAALGLMILLLVLTFYCRPEYQIWQFTHKFLGVAFFLGALHVWLVPSDIAHNGWLRWYIFSLGAIALTLYIRHSILYAHRKYWYQVERTEKLNEAVWRVVMTAEKQTMSFRAGQFAWFRFIDGEVLAERHPFSMASAPNDDYLEIIVKDLGNFTHAFGRLAPGTKVEVQWPYGRFNFQYSRYKRQIWIGGGIGLTPFMSMGRDLRLDVYSGYTINLILAVRNASETFALDEIYAMEKAAKGRLRVQIWYSDEKGFLTVESIKELSGKEMQGTSFYICGPPTMMASLREQLLKEKIADRDIHSEGFEL